MAKEIIYALSKTGNFTDNFSETELANYRDSVPFALKLNNPSYQLEILPPTTSNPSTAPVQDRQLWVRDDVDDPEDPIPPAQPVTIIIPTRKPGSPIVPKPATAPIVSDPTSKTSSQQNAQTPPLKLNHNSSSRNQNNEIG
jgi:hypothetical protein